MGLLESEKYDKVIVFGKQAVAALKENNIQDFSLFGQRGWDCFPEPKNNWNQAYNYCKMIYKGFFNNKDFLSAEIWLNRMIDVNNSLRFEDDEVLFETAKYHFEIGCFEEAIGDFKKVVKEAGFRYFENEDPKYLDFFRNPDKYIKP